MISELIITGRVCKGIGEGRQLGYPTANLDYKLEKNQKLGPGIYAGRIFWDEGGKKQEYVCAVVIGGDWKEEPLKFEAFIIDFDEDIYDKNVSVLLLDKIRDMEHFESMDALKKQIEKDILKVKQVVNKYV